MTSGYVVTLFGARRVRPVALKSVANTQFRCLCLFGEERGRKKQRCSCCPRKAVLSTGDSSPSCRRIDPHSAPSRAARQPVNLENWVQMFTNFKMKMQDTRKVSKCKIELMYQNMAIFWARLIRCPKWTAEVEARTPPN